VLITELFGRVPYLPVITVVVTCAAGATLVQATNLPSPTTGRIEGFVRLVAMTTAAIPSGAYPSRRVSRPAASASEMKHVVVFVKDAPRADSVGTVRREIIQKDESFDPAVVAITRGSTVEFPNSDPYFHNVFSLSRAATFDLGRYPRGNSRARVFNRAGLVKVYCHIHSHMSASIMVFDHDHFTIPNADGFFTLDGVAPGSYRLSAWHERIGENVQQVKVDPGGHARVEFSLPVNDRDQ
jgi:plastocyanin